MASARRLRVLLIGPYPPPDTGVTMPFKLFCDWLERERKDDMEIGIFRTHTDRKPLLKFFYPQVFFRLLGVLFAMPLRALAADRVVIFGSNRFVSLVGGPMTVLLRVFRKPVSLRIFGGAFELYFQSRPAPIRWLIKRMFGLCDRIVAEPELSAVALRAVWPRQIRGVRNYRVPIDDVVRNPAEPLRVRFIFVGNVRGLKGCGELLAAFADLKRRLQAENPDVRVTLDLYGPDQATGSDPVVGIDQARRDPDITFHGPVANHVLQSAYQQSDVFVYPTYWPTEGHSGAVIEALFCGLPVLASDWRANTEVVHEGVNGVICKPKDAVDLANCMLRLATDPQLRERLSAGALREAKQYDSAVVCPELAEALGL